MNMSIKNITVILCGLIVYHTAIHSMPTNFNQWVIDTEKFYEKFHEFMNEDFKVLKQAFENNFLHEEHGVSYQEEFENAMKLHLLDENTNQIKEERAKNVMSIMIALHESGNLGDEELSVDEISDAYIQNPNAWNDLGSFGKHILSHVRRLPASSQKRYYCYLISGVMITGGAAFCYYGWKNWQASAKKQYAKKRKIAKKQLCLGGLLCVVGAGLGWYTYNH